MASVFWSGHTLIWLIWPVITRACHHRPGTTAVHGSDDIYHSISFAIRAMDVQEISTTPPPPFSYFNETWSPFCLLFRSSSDNTNFSNWSMRQLETTVARIQLGTLGLFMLIVFLFQYKWKHTIHVYFVANVVSLAWVILLVVLPSVQFRRSRNALRWVLYVNMVLTKGLLFFAPITPIMLCAEMILALCSLYLCGFPFRELLPFHFVAITASTLCVAQDATLDSAFPTAFGNILVYLIVAFVGWDRETLLKKMFVGTAGGENQNSLLVKNQKNAAHDIRNALFEVISLVEMAKMNALSAMIPSESKALGPGPHADAQANRFNTCIQNTACSITGGVKTIEGDEGDEGGEGDERYKGNRWNRKDDQEGGNGTTGTVKVTNQDDNGNNISRYGVYNVESKDNTQMDVLSLRVQDVTSRIMHRLDASLRDGDAVVHNDMTRLNPHIKSCNLRSIMEQDLVLDDLVVLTVSEDFPSTIETDVPWMRTIVQNLVHNAKKHGPVGGRIDVRMTSLNDEASIEVSDQGKGVDPARAR